MTEPEPARHMSEAEAAADMRKQVADRTAIQEAERAAGILPPDAPAPALSGLDVTLRTGLATACSVFVCAFHLFEEASGNPNPDIARMKFLLAEHYNASVIHNQARAAALAIFEDNPEYENHPGSVKVQKLINDIGRLAETQLAAYEQIPDAPDLKTLIEEIVEEQ